MSLVAVYDALKEAKVSDHKATAVIEALETSLDEPWKRRIEERLTKIEISMEARFARLEWMCRVNMILISVCLALLVGVLLRAILA